MTLSREQEQPEASPTLQELQPGGMSVDGFLERNQTLEQVVERDRKALTILGYTAQEIADLLSPFVERVVGSSTFSYEAPNGKCYDVKIINWRGWQECPWHDNARSNIDIHLTETGGQRSVRIAGLLRHLAGQHGFFEGGQYRVAPETIVEMFGVEKVPESLKKVKELMF